MSLRGGWIPSEDLIGLCICLRNGGQLANVVYQQKRPRIVQYCYNANIMHPHSYSQQILRPWRAYRKGVGVGREGRSLPSRACSPASIIAEECSCYWSDMWIANSNTELTLLSVAIQIVPENRLKRNIRLVRKISNSEVCNENSLGDFSHSYGP